MNTILKSIFKCIIILIVTFIVFVILMKIIGNLGGVPQSIKNAYKVSFIMKNGLFYPATIVLMVLIFTHLLLNYIYLQNNIRLFSQLKGTCYGFAFGILWFLGFLELALTYHSDYLIQVSSGIRDLLSLTVFGTMTGIFFTDKKVSMEKKESIMVILPTSIFFAIFHGIQYYLTFKVVEQKIDNIFIGIWLLSTGAWIGVMYYYFSPRINNILLKTMFFAFNVFGINWLLYNLFFNLFIEIPVLDILIRCFMGSFGVFIGLSVYEYINKVCNRGSSA